MATPTLIFDDACPMCKAYTATFNRAGWCDRAAFSEVGAQQTPAGLDLDRARHEIPLLDPDSGTVYYGLDAMTRVMARGMPSLEPVLRSRFLRILLTPLYKIITYNRRIIAGTHAPTTGFDCAPDRDLGWRWAYIVVMLLAVVSLELPVLLAYLAAAGGLLGVIWATDRLSYLGHLVTVLFLATLVACCLPEPVNLVAASLVAGFEAHRRG